MGRRSEGETRPDMPYVKNRVMWGSNPHPHQINIWRDSMEFLSEHWVLIYGMFMYGMGVLTGSIKK